MRLIACSIKSLYKSYIAKKKPISEALKGAMLLQLLFNVVLSFNRCKAVYKKKGISLQLFSKNS